MVGLFPQDRVTIVGVMNLTPDSFSDGGRFHRTGTSEAIDLVTGVHDFTKRRTTLY